MPMIIPIMIVVPITPENILTGQSIFGEKARIIPETPIVMKRMLKICALSFISAVAISKSSQ